MPNLRIGIDVGGTNTDAVLLDANLAKTPVASVLTWHKTLTSPDITSGIQEATRALLATSSVNADDINCITLGTTHLINALVERDAAKLSRVGVVRLASQGFTHTTPPLVEFPQDLRDVIYGGHAIVDGGLQIDGSEIGPINKEQILRACEQLQHNNVHNVVVCGTFSPIDSNFHQETNCAELIRENLKPIDVFCSADVGGLGILERENAAVLNAALHDYASFVFNGVASALQYLGMDGAPIYISTNGGSMIPVNEAVQFPLQSTASGPANSMTGAAYLASKSPLFIDHGVPDYSEAREKLLVLDVGGTTTDAGVLMTNGFPRHASAYMTIAGVQVNSSMPDASSVPLGGGSIIKTNTEGIVTGIGPESVGNQLTTRALCFGGNVMTLTDIAVAIGHAPNVGTAPVSLDPATVASAQDLLLASFQEVIASTKTQAKPLPVTVVGGGAIICPEALRDSSSPTDTDLASVANAVGAACAQVTAVVDAIYETSVPASHEEERKFLKLGLEKATKKCVDLGALPGSVRTIEQQVLELPYMTGKIRIVIKVVGDFDADSARKKSKPAGVKQYQSPSTTRIPNHASEKTRIVYPADPRQEERLVSRTNASSYHPNIRNGVWALSEIDIEWLSIGCYILGCGGGGSPHLPAIEVKQLLRQGKTLGIVNAQDLPSTAILPPVGVLGSPMVGQERPGGNLCADALDNLLTHQGLSYFDAGLCVEIGGANGLSPLLRGRAGREDRPMVDGDLMGRAFPTYEMITPYLHNEDINDLLPASLASGTGTNMILQKAESATAVDKSLRACCVTMGCAAGVASRPLTAEKFLAQGLPNTHSLAWRLGRGVQFAQSGCWNGDGGPAGAVIEQCGGSNSAKVIFAGKIIEVSNRLVKGHSVGQVIIEGTSQQHLRISFKNENLVAEIINTENESREILATVPDLITVLDARTGLAIGVPEYRYGLRVEVLAIAAPDKWTSSRGLAIAGPEKFGFDTSYHPVGVYSPPRSVIVEFGI